MPLCLLLLLLCLQDDAQVLLDLPDPFARLLMHGLAQFHGLTSTTCSTNGRKAVLLQCQQQKGSPEQQQQQPVLAPPQQQQQQQGLGAHVTPQQFSLQAQQADPMDYTQAAAAAAGAASAAATGAGAGAGVDEEMWLLPPIMCSDIVGALQEMGGALDHHALEAHVDRAHA
jgi:hypothetical protein